MLTMTLNTKRGGKGRDTCPSIMHMRSCPSENVCACRVLVAEGSDALYVAFMGTKQRRDLLTNANAVLMPLWHTSGVQGQVSLVSSSFRLSSEVAATSTPYLVVVCAI